jgi:hypothetical protein
MERELRRPEPIGLGIQGWIIRQVIGGGFRGKPGISGARIKYRPQAEKQTSPACGPGLQEPPSARGPSAGGIPPTAGAAASIRRSNRTQPAPVTTASTVSMTPRVVCP